MEFKLLGAEFCCYLFLVVARNARTHYLFFFTKAYMPNVQNKIRVTLY